MFQRNDVIEFVDPAKRDRYGRLVVQWYSPSQRTVTVQYGDPTADGPSAHWLVVKADEVRRVE